MKSPSNKTPKFIKRKDDGAIFYLGRDGFYHSEKIWESGSSIVVWELCDFPSSHFEFLDDCQNVKFQDGYPAFLS